MMTQKDDGNNDENDDENADDENIMITVTLMMT